MKPAKAADLGALPEWNLADLYPAIDSPDIRRDLDRGESECVAFEKDYKGKLLNFATERSGWPALAEAVRRYEAVQDLLGRVVSYASLVYAGNTTDPVRAKFYGDVQERITAISLHLLFFTLELNRIDDNAARTGDGGSDPRPLPALDRGCAQGKAVSARRPHRAIVPRKIRERLFGMEPAVR